MNKWAVLIVSSLLALCSLQCIENFWHIYELESDGKTSKDFTIRLLDDKLTVQVIAKSPTTIIQEDTLSLLLYLRVETRNIENVVLQPDSIAVLYRDRTMSLIDVKPKALSNIQSSREYWVSVYYKHPRKKWREFRANPSDPHDSWLKIAMDRFIKVDGDYVPIDTVFMAGN